MTTPQIVWLRRDLRITDQPALYAAAQAGPVIPVYVLDDDAAGDHAYGGASRWWLHHSLACLGRALEARGSRLVLRRGDAVGELCRIAGETGAEIVHANRHYEPWWRTAQGKLRDKLELQLHDANYLLPPGAVRTGSGSPYKIYTPFSKATQELLPPRDPVPEPAALPMPDRWPESDRLEHWNLLPVDPDWAGGMRDAWDIGEEAAHVRIGWWLDHVDAYDEARNLPSIDGSSRLSPYLHFGEISPVQLWHALKDQVGKGRATFEKELIWRDYAQNVICQFPDYSRRSHRDGWDGFAWRDPERDNAAARDLSAWQRGRTGYPIVDAGMRQLWQTGWMHNRVRMIAASFLVKHLLIDWRYGERWFWHTLVDADYGNNGVNWQWVAGTGVDSNMFVRITAPLVQSGKFAAEGYIREYVPELAHVDDADIHDPPDAVRPANYPGKTVGHREGRERALAAYRDLKG